MDELKQVTKTQFYGAIYGGGLDVHPTILGRFPYTSEWRFHRQDGKPLLGKTIDRVDGGKTLTEYWLAS